MAGRARERQRAGGSPEEDAKLFRQLDSSGNGYLSGTELDQANSRAFDADQDHRVTLAEFLAGRARERGAAPPAPRAARSTPRAARTVRPASRVAASPVAVKLMSIGRVEQPAVARFAGGGPVGLFFMTRFWSYTGTLEKAVWYFAPDGRVYQNLETGFSASDLAAHEGPRGTYRAAGNTMQIRWSDGKVTKSEVERDGVHVGRRHLQRGETVYGRPVAGGNL